MAKLYFTYAAMNAGKSTILLQSAFNYRERGMAVVLLTAAIDNRQSVGEIHSRIGLSERAHMFDEKTDIEALVLVEHGDTEISCVFIDEAQFLSRDQVLQLASLVDRHSIPVMCYGLRTDFRGELFEGSQALLAIADILNELKSICHCGRKATMNLRIDDDGQAQRDGKTIEIGGNERYVPLCRKHFFERTGNG